MYVPTDAYGGGEPSTHYVANGPFVMLIDSPYSFHVLWGSTMVTPQPGKALSADEIAELE